ncbi:bifunctional proline dehydrogenase/L-glutamate gamma-semialdehyde dehydrogenase PutA [Asticcacaulis sp. 201]|uniref:bifunctional proline dehydrogenase/L-glutamate gamma-semialdehyde dehydrogenase PutA n=1 Tax=Asticcacaulis sp. 201 TaxID=3028787 RepID=UPI00291622DB|nr:bifunctional proline dehydrogenase/L-glutamate gamma-semialdehyde dehydrogenase PutA [Asticcacaulis sp. 201]MDV6332646.1 bifunctional proline dehydrogenase/L-glutamate gamma-semialdehyde dehydrogenase PutA [Asticcacaulis sp. 201]
MPDSAPALRAYVFDWDSLDSHKYISDAAICAALLQANPLDDQTRAVVRAEAESLVRATRKAAQRQGVVESFLKEFSLGTAEGLALMCLAEALLRTPDEATRDQLIAEKIASADWASHLGQSDNWFVNASTWGLMLTGKIIDVEDKAKSDVGGYITGLAARLGEPVIRRAVAQAIRIMGEQFVLGRTIEAALKRSKKDGYLCSFDMLGEGARTEADAVRYAKAYEDAIVALSKVASRGPEADHGISVKLSALYSRYEAARIDDVMADLYPRLKPLAILAARANINFTLDAEETDRLALSLKVLDRLCHEPELGAWKGLGLAVQAYQKRCPDVIAALRVLAEKSGRRLMVRLVKGAYWDTEIKRAQVMGREDYPVHTTKAATDLSYLVCAKALIDAAPHIYSQFATHNAHSLAAVRRMANAAGVTVEFQRLHGMGEQLYAQAAEQFEAFPLRAYAPVGGHEDLLPYLVRRLLENGANSSFVNALLDEKIEPKDVISDPVDKVRAHPDRHARLPLPRDLYGDRLNSFGPDVSIAAVRDRLRHVVHALDGDRKDANALIGGKPHSTYAAHIFAPADITRIVGDVHEADPVMIKEAFARAQAAQPAWNDAGGDGRATVLEAMADALESKHDKLCAVMVREAGKTWPDAIAEVREAADFCRYYAKLAREQFSAPTTLTGPVGERNAHLLHGRGVFVCISPWNFPLAIFTGQIAAALAAGNAVLAKPAEQTPLIAQKAVKLFYGAGLHPDLLALLPGDGATIGAALVAYPGIAGVAFTGGTDTARRINLTLAQKEGPIVPFVAETGGLNGMFVDTTALKEQVVDDVIASAFGSAGQRCSALRLLFLPHELADSYIETLKGAMDMLTIGDPADFTTDIGPVIDADAKAILQLHLETLQDQGKILHRTPIPESLNGHFFAPTLAELTSPTELEREVFGPILHVIRYDSQNPDEMTKALAGRGYGLTLGVHSRLEAFAEKIMHAVPAGNVYVNRTVIGAVVGVQPFGGEGLSGTGPKAGGPLALTRFASERAISINITAQGGDPALLNL